MTVSPGTTAPDRRPATPSPATPPGRVMTSRERVELALAHREADRVPLDLGGTLVTGMHVSSVYKLRQALGLDPAGTPVKVIEPFQMLGEIAPDLLDALAVDVVAVGRPTNMYGFTNTGWKPWSAFDGIPLLVPGDFPTERERSGELLMYPCADRSAPPCARMPKNGFYFDQIIRQDPIDEEHLDLEGNLEEFAPISDEAIAHIRAEIERLAPSGRAIVGDFGGMGFGDVALVPGPTLRHPRGIRDLEEWYMSLVSRPGYVAEIFERQCEVALANLARIHAAIGDGVTAVFVTGADFGGQQGPLISPKTYRTLFKPVHTAINDWIHANTGWKTFIHSCGSILRLLDDIVDAGFDALNPVQTSAVGMYPDALSGPTVTASPSGAGVSTPKDAPVRYAGGGPRDGPRADRDVRLGWRLRLQPDSQRPGRRTGGEPARALRGRGRFPRLPDRWPRAPGEVSAMGTIDELREAVIDGQTPAAVEQTRQGLAEGIAAQTLFDDGLMAAMRRVGELFEEGEVFVPEMLVAAHAMTAALDVLRPELVAEGAHSSGRVAIGTVMGDLHDIGKNLVAMMLQGNGFEIDDLGTDVYPERFVQAIRDGAEVIAMSALLTTTMTNMSAIVDAVSEAGLRDRVAIVVGGAPITQAFADEVGADGYARDASSAVRLVASVLERARAADGH